MAQLSFSASVDAWVRKSNLRMELVFKESTQRVFEAARLPVGSGGNMPVDTGFLRASFLTTLNAPATSITFNPGTGPVASNDTEVALTISKADLGDTIYGVFTASYARPVEYGSNGRPGRGFVRLAAQQWKQIVAAVIREAKSRVP